MMIGLACLLLKHVGRPAILGAIILLLGVCIPVRILVKELRNL